MIQEKPLHFNLRQLFPQPWPIIWVWILLVIILVGLVAPQSFLLTCVKLGGILLCLIYAAQTFPSDRLLQAALLTTFIADLCLAADNTSNVGLLIFLGTQLIHAWRLSSSQFRPYLVSFILLIILAIFANALLQFTPQIYVICTCYAITLITNVLLCWQWQCQQPQNPRAWIATIGFVLFVCCDICTGTSYFSLIGAFPGFLYAPANFFAWFFYYPSQIFISNSSKCDKMLSKGR